MAEVNGMVGEGVGDIDLDLAAPFLARLFSRPPENSSADDEKELVKLTQLGETKSAIMNTQQEKMQFTQEFLQDDIQEFLQKLRNAMKDTNQQFLRVEVQYNHLTIETDALMGDNTNPTVGNSIENLFRKVTCRGGLQTRPVKILDNVTGVLKPRRLTLLLGPPGGGKSVYLQALSGRLKEHSGLRFTGDIKYNGVDINDICINRTAGMVKQTDDHIANLSVLETVQFANDCQQDDARTNRWVGAVQNHLESKSTAGLDVSSTTEENGELSAVEEGKAPTAEDLEFLAQLKKSLVNNMKPYLFLRILGIDGVADTVVGDAQVRGVSGGQRKRVTSAEILTADKWVIFMDEISTGLDAATTYSIVESLRDICHSIERQMVMSLLQPAPEVLDLFDDIILLTEGKVMYHGPVSEVFKFYEDVGFNCPPRKDKASFLQEITTPVGQLMFASTKLLASAGFKEPRRTPEAIIANPPKELIVSVDEMVEKFWKDSPIGQTLASEASTVLDPTPESERALARTQYANSWYRATSLVMQRQFILLKRSRSFYVARSVQTIITALILASLYATFNNTVDDGRHVISMAMLSANFFTFVNKPQIEMVFRTKSVFLKQRDNNFFPPWSYVVSIALMELPCQALEAVLYSVLTYWITGYYTGAGYFFYYLLILFSTTVCMSSIFRLIAFGSPSSVIANAFGIFLILICIVLNGFSITADAVPDYLIWLYWWNPLAWSVRSISINELTAPGWGQTGISVLDSFGMETSRNWIWAGAVYMLGLSIICGLISSFVLKFAAAPSPRAKISVEEEKEQVKKNMMARLKRKATMAEASQGKNVTAPPPDSESMAIPFTPITLVCRNIQYYVPDPSGGVAAGVVSKEHEDKEVAGMLQLLKGFDFYSAPGQLTALMGGSGAGKTTLLDVVAGRKTTGIIRGDILVNGRPKQQESWARVVGYVEQMDIHSARSTVREALIFSARLRLDEKTVPWETVLAIVEDTLDTVELRQLQHSIVGDATGNGLTGEQRKRLSIAVELVSNPSVMFMDEPTSGLDARAAAIVMRAVRRIADKGRSVIVTIHQPSIEIFEVFDQLVLLQRGGRLTYFGPLGAESSELIKYLESKPGVEPIKPGVNPSVWMLAVTGGSTTKTVKAADLDFPAVYEESELFKENRQRMDAFVEDGLKNSEELKVGGKYATSLWTQYKMLAQKFIFIYWRSPHYNFTRVMFSIAVALIYGITYLNQGKLNSNGANASDIQNIMGVIFSMSFFLGTFNAATVIGVASSERLVFYRERAARYYAPFPYNSAQGVAEFPYLLTQAVILVCISYFMIGFQAIAWKFFYFLLMMFCAVATFTFMGQFLVQATPSPLLAALSVTFLIQVFTYFNGFFVTYPRMPEGWKWANRCVPTTWVIYGLSSSQLSDRTDIPFIYTAPDGAERTTNANVATYMSDYYGYHYDMTWWCILITAGYMMLFRSLGAFFLTFVSYQKR